MKRLICKTQLVFPIFFQGTSPLSFSPHCERQWNLRRDCIKAFTDLYALAHNLALYVGRNDGHHQPGKPEIFMYTKP